MHRVRLGLLTCVFCVMLVLGAPAAGAQPIDEDVPPGNPVIGSDAPGDTEPEDGRSYGLLALVAVCLIGAGVLLVKVERWEARRIDEPLNGRD